MKYFTVFVIVAFIACSSEEKEEQVIEHQAINWDKSTKNNKGVGTAQEGASFNIMKYKEGIDSVLSDIVGQQSQIVADTLMSDDLLFTELKRTPLSSIISKTERAVKYSFPLSSDGGLKHHFFILSFKNETTADSLFSVIKDVAISKSGVPGLTYRSDYIVVLGAFIYWINSNCSFSYENHKKFVEVFQHLMHTEGKTMIKCECGKVLCRLR
jgi:hypothetical protein